MALTKITYDDKVALNSQPSIAAKNKVQDSDMNEIKSVVNNAIDQVDTNTSDISTINTNKAWIDIDTSGWTKSPNTLEIKVAKYNALTREVWISIYCAAGIMNTSNIISGIQEAYRPSSEVGTSGNGVGYWTGSPNTSSPSGRIDVTVKTNGQMQLFYPVNSTMYQLGFTVRYIV